MNSESSFRPEVRSLTSQDRTVVPFRLSRLLLRPLVTMPPKRPRLSDQIDTV